MARREPPRKRSLPEIISTAAYRLSLLAGAILIFLWLQDDPGRWDTASRWLLIGMGAMIVLVGAPRVVTAVKCWRMRGELARWFWITGGVAAFFTAPLALAGLSLGGGAMLLGAFWAGVFWLFAMLQGEDACRDDRF
ncbi:hypothetical protein [Thioalkalivibrio sp. ALE21]|uniref:hypothetical protein n=1 Tax=Thioalkalivibrio sp. ALE21 TaxID=1158175 RepID=UPI000DA1E4CA|nr:hypothetical protein [Thioalkalivibrio sp. ALE21]